LVEKAGPQGGKLIRSLHEIQAEHNYLPKEQLRDVSERLGVPLSQVYSVATFFTSFSLTPVGKYVVNVCMGTTCHVRGADGIVEYLERRLEIPRNAVSEDGLFTLRLVRCVGCCSLAPVMIIAGRAYGKLTRTKVERIIRTIRKNDH